MYIYIHHLHISIKNGVMGTDLSQLTCSYIAKHLMSPIEISNVYIILCAYTKIVYVYSIMLMGNTPVCRQDENMNTIVSF